MKKILKQITRPIVIPILQWVGLQYIRFYVYSYKFVDKYGPMNIQEKRKLRQDILRMIQDSRDMDITEATVELRRLIEDYPE